MQEHNIRESFLLKQRGRRRRLRQRLPTTEFKMFQNSLAINSVTAHSIRSRCSKVSKYEYYRVLPCWSRAWLICSLSHCLNPGIGDSVEYCVMFGNSCCNCSTTCFIRKLPRSTPLSPARKQQQHLRFTISNPRVLS